ncbi:MAG: HD domain-containing protein [Spirochaetales bacterium]|nr:HD domain-containing protein [Spirochaetales bacterium]
MRKNISIEQRARNLKIAMIVFIVVSVMAAASIIALHTRAGNFYRTSAEFYEAADNYLAQLRLSDGHLSYKVSKTYKQLLDVYARLDPLLKQEVEIEPPHFDNNQDLDLLLLKVENYIPGVRSNMSNFIRYFYFRVVLMLVIFFTAGIVLLIVVFLMSSAISKYNKEVNDGLGNIEKLLRFEKVEVVPSKETNIIEIKWLYNNLQKLSKEIIFNRSPKEKGLNGSLDELLHEMRSHILERMSCDRIALAFLSSTGKIVAETAETTYDKCYLNPGFSEYLKSTSLGNVVETFEPRMIQDLDSYHKDREISLSSELLLKEGIRASITLPIIFSNKCLGFVFVSSKNPGAYTETMVKYANRIVGVYKSNLYFEYLIQQVVSETSSAFVDLMQEKDNETAAHISRMSLYSYIIANSYHKNIKHLHPGFMREILLFSPLHDIGKVGIPDNILLKEGILTKAEKKKMEEHVMIGQRVIEKMNSSLLNIIPVPLMNTAVDIIAGHHEKFNGKGYPLGLKGESIPLAGRIVSVADVFDALTSKRPYKDAWTVDVALNVMENEMKDSFDPEVFEAFKMCIPEILEVYEEQKEI